MLWRAANSVYDGLLPLLSIQTIQNNEWLRPQVITEHARGRVF